MLMTATQASDMVGVNPQTFKKIASDPVNGIKPVTRAGSSRKWFRRAEVERLALGDQIEENACNTAI